MGKAIKAQVNPFELVWHTLEYEDGYFYRSVRIHQLGNCTGCYTAQPVGSRCMECNFFQLPEDDVFYCRPLYFGHDDKRAYQLILEGQKPLKPKELSELVGHIPFADINGKRFVDKHQQPEVTDLLCYVREIHREDQLSKIVPAIYNVLEDATGASEETLEWTIGIMIRAPRYYFTDEELQMVLNDRRLRHSRRREDLVDLIIQLGGAPQHEVAAIQPPENEEEDDDESLF